MLRQFAAARGGKPRLPLSFREWCVDLPVVVRLISSGPRGEVGQLAEQHIQLYGAALDWNLLDALTPLARHRTSRKRPCPCRLSRSPTCRAFRPVGPMNDGTGCWRFLRRTGS